MWTRFDVHSVIYWALIEDGKVAALKRGERLVSNQWVSNVIEATLMGV